MPCSGLTNPASLRETIDNLFENQEYTLEDGRRVIITWSKLSLTQDQKAQLIPVYPAGLTPIDYFIIYQVDIYRGEELIETEHQLVSFLLKRDYLYGFYFNVVAQPRFEIEQLTKSKLPVELFSTARMIADFYLEIYNEIKGIIVILSLSSLNPQDPIATLQYSHRNKYFYTAIHNDGIRGADQFIPCTRLTGLSRNLREC